MRHSTHNRRRRIGASALEFALLFPVVMVMLAAIVDYGWYLSRAELVVQAAREGARAGAMTDYDASPELAATERAKSALAELGVVSSDPSITTKLVGTSPDMLVRVDISMPYEPLMGLLPVPKRVEASNTMRLEDR